MCDPSCESIREQLVEYADGGLPVAEAVHIESHLANCVDCRGQLGRLRQSLQLARSIWQESAETAVPAVRVTSGRRLSLAAAAVVAVVAVGVVWWATLRHPSAPDPERPMARADVSADVDRTAGFQEGDIESLIRREMQSARLAVAARVLASDPDLHSYQVSAEKYLMNAYDTSGQ